MELPSLLYVGGGWCGWRWEFTWRGGGGFVSCDVSGKACVMFVLGLASQLAPLPAMSQHRGALSLNPGMTSPPLPSQPHAHAHCRLSSCACAYLSSTEGMDCAAVCSCSPRPPVPTPPLQELFLADNPFTQALPVPPASSGRPGHPAPALATLSLDFEVATRSHAAISRLAPSLKQLWLVSASGQVGDDDVDEFLGRKIER